MDALALQLDCFEPDINFVCSTDCKVSVCRVNVDFGSWKEKTDMLVTYANRAFNFEQNPVQNILVANSNMYTKLSENGKTVFKYFARMCLRHVYGGCRSLEEAPYVKYYETFTFKGDHYVLEYYDVDSKVWIIADATAAIVPYDLMDDYKVRGCVMLYESDKSPTVKEWNDFEKLMEEEELNISQLINRSSLAKSTVEINTYVLKTPWPGD